MKPSQPSLFDPSPSVGAAPPDPERTADLRANLRARIETLRAATRPLWATEMEIILEGGAFVRSLRRLPREEAAELSAAYDRELDRLYEMWLDEHVPWTEEEREIAVATGRLRADARSNP